MKSVLITGCSDGGIGSMLAVAFQARGFKVFATTRLTDKMQCLEPIKNIFLLFLDVTSLSSIASAVDTECAGIHFTLNFNRRLLVIGIQATFAPAGIHAAAVS